MIPTFNSTASFYTTTRSAVLRMQRQLVVAQKELASGRKADIGTALGSQTGRSISMRLEISRLTRITDTNATVATRLDATQSVVENLTATAQSFLNTLLTARVTETGAPAAEQAGKADLVNLISALNTAVAGEYLFSGINTDVQPVTDYNAATTPPPANKAAVDSAIAAFKASYPDPTADQMKTFLESEAAGGFANLFTFDPASGNTGWTDNWSKASWSYDATTGKVSGQYITSRISTSELADSSSSANNQAFRKLAQAFTMVAELDITNLNKEAYDTVLDRAMTLTGEAIQNLGVEAGRLGTSQERVTRSNERMAAQKDILTTQINNLEVVDPYDAATRVNSLSTQLETAYALTARVQNLRLLNYL